MKRITKILAATVAAVIAATGIGIGATTAISGVTKVDYKFKINEDNITLPSDLVVMSKENTTYVPLRFLSESMDSDVDFKQGVISITNGGYVGSSLESDKKQIEELQKEIEVLKAENSDLLQRLDASQSLNFHKELPAVADSGNGLRVTLTQISKDTNGAQMYIEIENTNTDKYFVVDPYKTEVIVEGKLYKASIKTEAILNATLSQAADKNSPTSTSGYMYIEGLTDTKIKGNMIIEYSENITSGKKMQMSFDNTK